MSHHKDAKVGDEIKLSKVVDKYRPIYYAGGSGDYNPIHIDADFAKAFGLQTNILQGNCTYAFCQQAVVDWAGKDPGLLKRLKVDFRGNVLPGDTVNVKGKVIEKTPDKVVIEFTAENQSGGLVIGNGLAELALG